MLRSSELTESGIRVSSRILEKYLLGGERVLVATRHHWIRFAEPVATVVVGFVAVAWVVTGLDDPVGSFAGFLWLAWLGSIGRLVWRFFAWRHEWFCATDKRLLSTYGLFTQKVAMMPLGKVTDMNYGRSIPGRLLGYGVFTLESAGQDQALRQIEWVPNPDDTYRKICVIIFGEKRTDSDDSLDTDHPPRPHLDPTTVYPRPPLGRSNPRRSYIPRLPPADDAGARFDPPDDRR